MNPVLEHFATRQMEIARDLAQASDLLEIHVLDACHLIARFSCLGLIRSGNGEVSLWDDFAVGIRFSERYLREGDSMHTISWLAPAEIFQPNIYGPAVCLGPIAPATPVDELLYRTHELITWNALNPREDDALNSDACVWARNHGSEFPVDRRPLKWTRGVEIPVEVRS